jgi:hypothetical protein
MSGRLELTYFGANGWLLEFADATASLRVLLDPWLVGPLVFPPGPWLLQGEMPSYQPVPERLDLLLLTQGLPDHAHPASLDLLPRQLPVVAARAAARLCLDLGFANVTTLGPGQRQLSGALTITATAGAPVPQLQNGYLLEHPLAASYLEPHGFLPPVSQLAPRRLDAVITPVIDLGLPLGGPLVKGRQALPELLRRFQPRTVLASSAGGGVEFKGLLSPLLRQRGTLAEAAQVVAAAGLEACQLIDPQPGVPISLPLGAQF